MGRHKIAVVPGDGIGKEVIGAGVEVMVAWAKAAPGLDRPNPLLSSAMKRGGLGRSPPNRTWGWPHARSDHTRRRRQETA